MPKQRVTITAAWITGGLAVVAAIIIAIATILNQKDTSSTTDISSGDSSPTLANGGDVKNSKIIPERAHITVDIPLTAGWEPQGPGSIKGGCRDDILEFDVNLHGGDDYAELFLDLRAARLPEIERNQDGSYNLAGAEIIAVVRSDQDFRGNPDHPNGAQILLKTNNGRIL